MFQAEYNDENLLQAPRDRERAVGLPNVFAQKNQTLSVNGKPRAIQSSEFVRCSLNLPMLTDYLRTETMMTYLNEEKRDDELEYLTSNLR